MSDHREGRIRRPWRVVALVDWPDDLGGPSWHVERRCLTKWGAAFAAWRRSRQRRPLILVGMPEPVGYAYAHEDVPLPALDSAADQPLEASDE